MINNNENQDSLSTSNFKVKGLKVFGSKENLYQNEKKYRKVYDESECRYIYCELSFYNKLFDESDWKCDIRFLCRDMKTGQQVCELNKPLLVRKRKKYYLCERRLGYP